MHGERLSCPAPVFYIISSLLFSWSFITAVRSLLFQRKKRGGWGRGGSGAEIKTFIGHVLLFSKYQKVAFLLFLSSWLCINFRVLGKVSPR